MSFQPRAPASRDLSQAARNADPQLAIDRRRVDCIEDVNSALIPLLRHPLTGALLTSESEGFRAPRKEAYETDNLAPARGIALGLVLVSPFWACIAALCWWFFNG